MKRSLSEIINEKEKILRAEYQSGFVDGGDDMAKKEQFEKNEKQSKDDFKYNQMIIETQKKVIQFGEWSNVGLTMDGFHFIIHDVLQSAALEFEIKELEPLILALKKLDEGLE